MNGYMYGPPGQVWEGIIETLILVVTMTGAAALAICLLASLMSLLHRALKNLGAYATGASSNLARPEGANSVSSTRSLWGEKKIGPS